MDNIVVAFETFIEIVTTPISCGAVLTSIIMSAIITFIKLFQDKVNGSKREEIVFNSIIDFSVYYLIFSLMSVS